MLRSRFWQTHLVHTLKLAAAELGTSRPLLQAIMSHAVIVCCMGQLRWTIGPYDRQSPSLATSQELREHNTPAASWGGSISTICAAKHNK